MRSYEEIYQTAKSTPGDHITITAEEMKQLVDAHVEHRRRTSGKVPQSDFLLRKTKTLRICGKNVIVEG